MSHVALSRRALLGGIAASAFVGMGRAALGGPLEDVLAAPAVDLHSHAGGLLDARAPKYDVARRMIQGKFGVVTMAAVADFPVIRQHKAFRQPGAGDADAPGQSGRA